MKTFYYAIVNKKGNLVTLRMNLPIYWNKEVAEAVKIVRCKSSDRVVRLNINALKRIIHND